MLQQSVNSLGEEMMRRYTENRRLEEFAYKFRRNNENYLKIRDITKEHLINFLTQAEPDKMALLRMALNSVVLALKENPNSYTIIFNSNSNNNNNNEYQQTI